MNDQANFETDQAQAANKNLEKAKSSKPDLFKAKLDLQPVLFEYFQQELFAGDKDKFTKWIIDNQLVLKNISDTIEIELAYNENIESADLAKVILEKLEPQLKKQNENFSVDNFDYKYWQQQYKPEDHILRP